MLGHFRTTFVVAGTAKVLIRKNGAGCLLISRGKMNRFQNKLTLWMLAFCLMLTVAMSPVLANAQASSADTTSDTTTKKSKKKAKKEKAAADKKAAAADKAAANDTTAATTKKSRKSKKAVAAQAAAEDSASKTSAG